VARLGRSVLPGQPQHVIQRGNDRAPVFLADETRDRNRAKASGRRATPLPAGRPPKDRADSR
jgi:hypothetical protein